MCHGRDANTRKAKLRLDVRDVATAQRDDLFPIKPGWPDESEVIARVTSTDDEERMPPHARTLARTVLSA